MKNQERWLMGSSSLLLGLLLVIPFYAQSSFASQGNTMSDQQTDSNKPAKIEYHLAKLTPRCVGRVLIDVPENFDTPKENKGSLMSKVLISSKANVRKEDFPYLLKQREDELKKEDEYTDKIDRPFLKETYDLHDGYGGVIFNRNEDASMDVSRTLEANIWRDNVAIRAEIKASDGRGKRYDELRKQLPPDLGIDPYGYDVPQQRQKLEAIIKRFKGWDGVHVPHEPGSCYGHVYITGPADFQEETGEWWIYNKNKNLHFSIDYDNFIQEKDTLLERIADRKYDGNTQLIRKGVVPLPKFPNAHAEGYITSNSRGEHKFFMIINEKIGSSKTPHMVVRFNDEGLLSKEDALAIWDAIIPTIRMRPGAF